MSFALGWSHLLFAAVALVLAARFAKADDRHWLRFFALAGGILCFLMLRDAEWIWDGLPLLQYVEFPWRLLLPVAICLALLVAAFARVAERWPRYRAALFASAMALLIVPNLSHLAPRGSRDVDLTQWTPHQIAVRGIEMTTALEYTPRWAEVRPPYSAHIATVLDGDADVQQTRRTPISWSAQVAAHRPSAIQLAISYFPGWRVSVDGAEVQVKPMASTGQIRFDVPQGDHLVEVEWSRTGLLWLADGISLAALMALLLLARA
jgi:hypothetical protein